MKLFSFYVMDSECHILFKELELFLYNSSMFKDMEFKNDSRY